MFCTVETYIAERLVEFGDSFSREILDPILYSSA